MLSVGLDVFSVLGGFGLDRPGGPAAEDDVFQGAVHGFAHDVGEDGAGWADQWPNDGEHGVGQHEALGAEGPPWIAV